MALKKADKEQIEGAFSLHEITQFLNTLDRAAKERITVPNLRAYVEEERKKKGGAEKKASPSKKR